MIKEYQPKKAVFARMASRPVPRVERAINVAREAGYHPVFCGAMREKGLTRIDTYSGIDVVRLGISFPLLNGKKIVVYLVSVFLFQLAFLRYLIKNRPHLVHASDFETMPAAIFYAKLFRSRLIYNVHDNLSQRYDLPVIIQRFLNTLEGIAVMTSEVTMVPETFRRDALPKWSHSRIKVVRNTPQNVSFSLPQYKPHGKIRLFYGGWLDWGRGIKEMVSIVERQPDVELRIAGEGSNEIVEYLKDKKGVTYLGYLNHKELIEETRCCNFVPAFYRPSTEINQNAASNKLAEALAVGRPLLLNDEVKIVQMLGDTSAVISRPFEHLQGIDADFLSLYRDEKLYRDACNAARRLYEKYYRWEVAHSTMIEIFSIK